MKVDFKITGGTVVDPERKINAQRDVLVLGNKIVEAAPSETVEAETTINADGCLVLPGLIDFHAHLSVGASESGISPDASLLPMGVTTGVDAGSCGSANFEAFARTTMATSQVRLFSFDQCRTGGSGRHASSRRAQSEILRRATNRRTLSQISRVSVSGLKIRLSKELVGNLGAKPLEATLRIAERLKCPVIVHTTNPPIPPAELAGMLRPGDVYCHVYQGTGDTIIGPDGKVVAGILKARRAGVLFDTANGRKNFSFTVAEAALADGFEPDIISTDVTRKTLFSNFVYSLPFTLMKFLKLGMALDTVIGACTSVPARKLGMQGKIGTLAPGAFADVAIFRRVKKQSAVAKDDHGNSITVDEWLIPQMTILDGKIAYRQVDFQ